MHDQLTQLDRGRCGAPVPYYLYETANLFCRGAGDSHLPWSMRARSPHVLSPPAAVPTANGRAPKVREPPDTAHELGDSAVALELDESSSRH